MELISQEGERVIINSLDDIVKAASDVRSDLFFVMVGEKPESEFLTNLSQSVKNLRNKVNFFYNIYNDLELEIEDAEYLNWEQEQIKAELDYYSENMFEA